MSEKITDKEAVRAAVRAGYAEIAQHGSERRKSSCCCGMSEVDSEALARHIGYTAEELAALPSGANIGLSCGNPSAVAALRPGEVLLDLGSGAGFDAFIAAPKVGPTGRVIGVDMTAEMLARARKNVAAMTDWEDPLYQKIVAHLPKGSGPGDYITSLEVTATKPGGQCCCG